MCSVFVWWHVSGVGANNIFPHFLCETVSISLLSTTDPHRFQSRTGPPAEECTLIENHNTHECTLPVELCFLRAILCHSEQPIQRLIRLITLLIFSGQQVSDNFWKKMFWYFACLANKNPELLTEGKGAIRTAEISPFCFTYWIHCRNMNRFQMPYS